MLDKAQGFISGIAGLDSGASTNFPEEPNNETSGKYVNQESKKISQLFTRVEGGALCERRFPASDICGKSIL